MQRPNNAGTPVVSVILYILAGLVFILGLGVAIDLFNAPNAIRGATIAFQTPVFKPLIDQITQAFLLAGGVLLVISLVFSGALVALGRLIAQNRRLAARVRELEARLPERSGDF